MKRLVCEMCGGSDLVKQDGVFVCQNCGTKYSVEEARKMMVEGTVSVEGTVAVEGTVKVDKSEELKKLYTLARRAKESDNTDNAVRYYTQIEMQDPDSWEAYFYLIYFKARTTTIREIPDDCKNLSNCFPTVVKLILQSEENDSEKRNAMITIMQEVSTISNIMTSSIQDISDKFSFYAFILKMIESLGDAIIGADKQNADIAISVWKLEFDLFISEMCYGITDKETANSLANLLKDNYGYDIRVAAIKIYEQDSFYDDPLGITQKLRKNETFITCPKCGTKFREREERCPNCNTSKEEIQRLIKEKETAESAERERLRKEAEAKAAEEARILKEKRAEWWKKNGKKVRISIISVIAVLAIAIASYYIITNNRIKQTITEAETYIMSGDSCVAIYKFDEAKSFYDKAYSCVNKEDYSYNVDDPYYEVRKHIGLQKLQLSKAQENADKDYEEASRKLKIFLEADDYQFNQYSNECLDKMIQIYPDRKETIYYKNLRK